MLPPLSHQCRKRKNHAGPLQQWQGRVERLLNIQSPIACCFNIKPRQIQEVLLRNLCYSYLFVAFQKRHKLEARNTSFPIHVFYSCLFHGIQRLNIQKFNSRLKSSASLWQLSLGGMRISSSEKEIRARNTFKLKIAWARVYTFAFLLYIRTYNIICVKIISARYAYMKKKNWQGKSLCSLWSLHSNIVHMSHTLATCLATNPRILARKRV